MWRLWPCLLMSRPPGLGLWVLISLRAQAAVQYIDVEGTPDMSLFVDEAQVAESVAGILSVLRESVTPAQLFEILEVP